MKHFKIIAFSTLVIFSLLLLKTQFYPNRAQQKSESKDVVAVKHQSKERKEENTHESKQEKQKEKQKEKENEKEKHNTEKIEKVKVKTSKKEEPSSEATSNKTKKEIEKKPEKKTNKKRSSSPQSKPQKEKEIRTKKTRTITQTLKYNTDLEYDNNLENGVKKVVQKGSNGQIVKEITEHYSNNRLISKDEKIIKNKQPVNEKIIIGTKKVENKPKHDNTNPSLEREVFNLVNKARTAKGLQPLTWNDALHQAARIRAEEIVSDFSHTRPNGQQWNTVAPNLALGENIAYGQRSAQDVHNAWMNSEGHKENVLRNNFKSIGVGLYISESGQKYWVQLFG